MFLSQVTAKEAAPTTPVTLWERHSARPHWSLAGECDLNAKLSKTTQEQPQWHHPRFKTPRSSREPRFCRFTSFPFAFYSPHLLSSPLRTRTLYLSRKADLLWNLGSLPGPTRLQPSCKSSQHIQGSCSRPTEYCGKALGKCTRALFWWIFKRNHRSLKLWGMRVPVQRTELSVRPRGPWPCLGLDWTAQCPLHSQIIQKLPFQNDVTAGIHPCSVLDTSAGQEWPQGTRSPQVCCLQTTTKKRKKLPPLLKDVQRNTKRRRVTAVPANRDLKDTNAHNLCSQWHFHWSQSPKWSNYCSPRARDYLPKLGDEALNWGSK